MDITVGCRLAYTIKEPTYFIFQIEAAKADGQIVKMSLSYCLPMRQRWDTRATLTRSASRGVSDAC